MRYSQTEIKKFIADNYGLPVKRMKRLPAGLMNLNYLIESGKNKYVFRINYLRSMEETAFTAEILEALAARKFPSPRIVEAKNRKQILLIRNKPCLLYKYIKGNNQAEINKEILKEMGFLLGKMHKSLRNFKPTIKKRTWDPEELKKIVKQSRRKMIKSKFKNAETLMDFMEAELEKFSFPASLPKGITHQDVKPENIVVKDYKIQGILDFDNAYRGVLLHDLTTPIIWTCFKDYKLDYRLLNSYLKGYEKSRKLSVLEKKYLLEGIKFRLAREAFIGPFAIYPYPEKSEKRSEYFRRLYRGFYLTTRFDFNKRLWKTRQQ